MEVGCPGDPGREDNTAEVSARYPPQRKKPVRLGFLILKGSHLTVESKKRWA